MCAARDVCKDKRVNQMVFWGNGVTQPTNWTKGLRPIGCGAFGEVYHANFQVNECPFKLVVKEVRIFSEQEKRKNEESVKREMRALKKLSHERIIKYYGSCCSDEKFHIFIELMEGGSLQDFIDRKYGNSEKIDEIYAGQIAKQILEGVEFLHREYHFHRDIKSANILMKDEQNIKLADFGLTREFEEITKTYTKEKGTIRFMAPEMFNSKIKYNKSVDIWSTGCVVIHMLSGKEPFAELEVQQVIFTLTQEDTSPAENIINQVSESCRNFLNICLARNPIKRTNAKSLLNHRFITGIEQLDVQVDAEMEETETAVNESLSEGPKQQVVTTTFNYAPHTVIHKTYTFEKDVHFNQEVHVDKIDVLNVNRIDKLKANKVNKVEAQSAGAMNVKEAASVQATSGNVHVEKTDTVTTQKTGTVNVGEAANMNAQAETINIESAENVNIP